MSLLLVAQRALTVPGWVKDFLWRRARAVPSLDLRFADSKSLADAVTGASLVTFTRASSGTFVDSAGVLRTAATDVPRFDHNPTTGESLGLLVEEARTNLLLRSEEFDNAAWTKSACSVTANSLSAPDGAATADFVVENSASAIHRVTFPTISFTASTVYTVSIFAKSTNRNLYINANTAIAARASFNLATGAINVIGAGSAAITAYANGWYRCSVTGTAPSTQTTGGFFQLNTNALAADETYTGDGTSGIYLWGAQLEAGAFPSSYIPTTGATATRAADVVSITGSAFSSWFRQDEGTVFVDGSTPAFTGTTGFVAINNAGNTNRLEIRQGRMPPTVTGASTSVTWTTLSIPTLIANTSYKQAVAFSNANHGNSIAGVLTHISSTEIPAIAATQLFFGIRDGQTAPTSGSSSTIKRLTFWTQRLPNPTLQSITS